MINHIIFNLMSSKYFLYFRWFLIIPASILGATLGQLLAILFGLIFPDWITHLLGSSFMASSFVLLGVLTAPNSKKKVGKILFITYSIIIIGIFVLSIYKEYEYNIWLLILNLIFGIFSGFEASNVNKKFKQ
jgi:hypothetical protein